MADSDTRPRGILTPDDREYLTGMKELTPQSERNTRARIRERLYHSILDFKLLWTHLDDRDLEMVFSPDDREEARYLRSYCQEMLAFTILGLRANGDHYPDRLKAAIQQAALGIDHNVKVMLEVEEEPMDSSELILHRMMDSENGEVTITEFERIWSDPDLDAELFAEFLNEMDPDEEYSVEWVREYQEELREVGVRPSPGYVLNIEPIWSDTAK